MRILQVFKDYYPPTIGGIEQHIHDIVHMTEGFEFSVLTSSRTTKSIIDNDGGVTVTRGAEYARPVSTPITPSWVNFLRRSDADLMHFHMPHPFGELAFLASRAKVPVVATYHGDIIGRSLLLPFFLPFQKRFLDRARRVIVSSRNFALSSRSLGHLQDKLTVIPFGVDQSKWQTPPPESDRIRQRYPGPIVLYMGRLARYKGVEILIEATRSLDVTCLIIGDGPQRTQLEAEVSRQGVRGKTHFLGWLEGDARSAYYHSADVFVLPSTTPQETFGIAMVEAMACGKPAVCTALGTGTSWVNQHNVTGLVVPPGDPKELARALSDLLADEARRQELGSAARKRIAEQFSAQEMIESISSLYRSIR